MLVPVYLLLLVLLLLILEAVIVRARVNRLALRVHVNGTRGKSSVTRYIAAGLRASGKKTIAKITGVSPTIIDTIGSQSIIKRRGGARVQEQISLIHHSAKEQADCLVLECMSIRPDLQAFESRAFRPHIYVLTNVLDDHQEELTDDPGFQIDALCGAMVSGSIIVTAPGAHIDRLNQRAQQLGNRLDIVSALLPEHKSMVPEGAFDVNIALALAVCNEAGIPETVSFPAIIKEATETVASDSALPSDGVRFINGFAVNDIPSAERFIAYWRQQRSGNDDLAIIFNARADRPLRSRSFAGYLPTIRNLNRIIVIGSHAPYMVRALQRSGFPSHAIVQWSRAQVKNARSEINGLGLGREQLLIGLGNIGGEGHLLVDALQGEVAHAV